MITIKNKMIIDGYVHITLSNGDEINIQTDWATQFVQEPYTDKDGNLQYRDTDKSLLEYEIEQAIVRAGQREKARQDDLNAAQNIIDSI